MVVKNNKVRLVLLMFVLFILMPLGVAAKEYNYTHVKMSNVNMIGNKFRNDISEKDKYAFINVADKMQGYADKIVFNTERKYNDKVIYESIMDALTYFPRGGNTLKTLEYELRGKQITVFPKYRSNLTQDKVVSDYLDKVIATIPKDWRHEDKIAYINAVVASYPYSNDLKDPRLNVNGISTQVSYSLLNGGGYCAAFVDMFNMAMDKMGVPAITVIGNAYEGGEWKLHEWSMIYIKNKWYHVDPTWTKGRINVKSVANSTGYFDGIDSLMTWNTFLVGDKNPTMATRQYDRSINPKAEKDLTLFNDAPLENRYRQIFINCFNQMNLPKAKNGIPMVLRSQYQKDSNMIYSFGFVDGLITSGSIKLNTTTSDEDLYRNMIKDWQIQQNKNQYDTSGKLITYQEGLTAYENYGVSYPIQTEADSSPGFQEQGN